MTTLKQYLGAFDVLQSKLIMPYFDETGEKILILDPSKVYRYFYEPRMDNASIPFKSFISLDYRSSL